MYPWYGGNAKPDYSISATGGPAITFFFNAGEYIALIGVDFFDFMTDDEVSIGTFASLSFITSQGRPFGYNPAGGNEGPVTLNASGQETIALGWGNSNERGAVDALALITVPAGCGSSSKP
ncbi:MAG: hypothetical protein JWP63_1324 [Candidatus Solibacter sp.]|nr:hypothetical protein [Candidatus Solibacter sp.]